MAHEHRHDDAGRGRARRAWMGRLTGRPGAAGAAAGAIAVALLLGGCGKAESTAAPDVLDAAGLAGEWTASPGGSIQLDPGTGTAVISGIPAESTAVAVGSACDDSWLPLLAGADWSFDAGSRAVRLRNDDALLPVDLALVVSDDGTRLSGVLCDQGTAADWVFTRAANPGE